jgi:hypothetical protein
VKFHLKADAFFEADDIDEALKQLAIHMLMGPEHDLFTYPSVFDLHGVKEGEKHECPTQG